MGMVKAHRQR